MALLVLPCRRGSTKPCATAAAPRRTVVALSSMVGVDVACVRSDEGVCVMMRGVKIDAARTHQSKRAGALNQGIDRPL